ncbi:MAG: hypothetical protein U5N56_03795 [Candidatus Marinimicrobia bacterium]|nr:hypothetical protein [Candidatus Neomarinimicrobiota bacterium]
MENNLSIWFSKRPKWLQIAATRLYYKRKLIEEDLSKIVSYCKQEAEGKEIPIKTGFPNISFIGNTKTNLRLLSISGIKGINALAPNKPLEFGNKDISVIYGKNGSGKSGYVRLLKLICGARTSENILHNVFDLEEKEKKAKIVYEKDGVEKSIEWIDRGICQDLKSLDIFDTMFGDIFVNQEDEVSYEPLILSFFSDLINVCEKVSRLLDQEKCQYRAVKQNMPSEYIDTDEACWYNFINSDTKQESVDKYCLIKEDIYDEIEALRQRLAEKDPLERARNIRLQIQYIDSIIDDADKFIWQLSTEKHQELISALKKYDSQKLLSDKTIKKVFEGSKLEGIGSEEWKSLWEAARAYSVNKAYIDNEYPNTDENSLCVLCHQPLSNEAKERFVSFEEFVKGNIEKE